MASVNELFDECIGVLLGVLLGVNGGWSTQGAADGHRGVWSIYIVFETSYTYIPMLLQIDVMGLKQMGQGQQSACVRVAVAATALMRRHFSSEGEAQWPLSAGIARSVWTTSRNSVENELF
jgi:hypothetical protein